MVELKHSVEKKFLEEEPRVLKVSPETQKVWAVELDLLQEFADVCARNNIRWFADGGTLLGAARHHGFIPWDDDIDVCLFRADYNRLCEIAPREFRHPYFFQTYQTDPECVRCHAQLRNSETTAIARDEMENGVPVYQFNQGIAMDIFPLDNIPDGEAEASDFLQAVMASKAKIWALKSLRRWAAKGTWKSCICRSGIKNALRCAQIRRHEKRTGIDYLTELADAHEKLASKFVQEKTELSCTISFWPLRKSRQYYHRSWFDETVYLDFEMLKVPAPIGYVKLLEGLYGDWQKHVIGGTLHGGVFYDTEKSYREYFK